jgi:hypothetical protein
VLEKCRKKKMIRDKYRKSQVGRQMLKKIDLEWGVAEDTINFLVIPLTLIARGILHANYN